MRVRRAATTAKSTLAAYPSGRLPLVSREAIEQRAVADDEIRPDLPQILPLALDDPIAEREHVRDHVARRRHVARVGEEHRVTAAESRALFCRDHRQPVFVSLGDLARM